MYPACFGTNPHFPQSQDFAVVQKDDLSGFGVVCYRSFEPGDLVAAITGDVIYEMTQHSLQIAPGVHLNDLYFAGYFLHSCAPNVSLDMRQGLVYAAAPIRPGDFLQMDYAQTEDRLFKQFPCYCGAPQCRRWITGRNEAIDETNPRYQTLISIGNAAE